MNHVVPMEEASGDNKSPLLDDTDDLTSKDYYFDSYSHFGKTLLLYYMMMSL